MVLELNRSHSSSSLKEGIFSLCLVKQKCKSSEYRVKDIMVQKNLRQCKWEITRTGYAQTLDLELSEMCSKQLYFLCLKSDVDLKNQMEFQMKNNNNQSFESE